MSLINVYWYYYDAQCAYVSKVWLLILILSCLNQKTYSKGITIQFKEGEDSNTFHGAFEQWKTEVVIQGT